MGARAFHWPAVVVTAPGVLRCGHCLGLADQVANGETAVGPMGVLRGWDVVEVECPECGKESVVKPGDVAWSDAVLAWQVQGNGCDES